MKLVRLAQSFGLDGSGQINELSIQSMEVLNPFSEKLERQEAELAEIKTLLTQSQSQKNANVQNPSKNRGNRTNQSRPCSLSPSSPSNSVATTMMSVNQVTAAQSQPPKANNASVGLTTVAQCYRCLSTDHFVCDCPQPPSQEETERRIR